MKEGEPGQANWSSEEQLTRSQKVAEYASIIAKNYELDRMTYEALSKYATACLRRKEIAIVFDGTTVKKLLYPVYEDEDGNKWRMTITREDYRSQIHNLSNIAFNLFADYLNSNGSKRAAAKEVQIIVSDLAPKSP